jgi:outer membrane lipoprotein-sorting protein
MELAELLELMYSAPERFTSLRATIRTWLHSERIRAAEEHRNELARGAVGVIRLGGEEEEASVESEMFERLWIARPGKWRSEIEGEHTQVTDGRRVWAYRPGWGTMVHEVEARSDDGDVERLMFDPSPFLAGVDLVVGDHETIAGRQGVRVRATPRKGFVDWHDWGGLVPGADAYELVVDAERGVILRAAASLSGEPVAVTELVDVSFDEVFPPETFVFEPPEHERVLSTQDLQFNPPEHVTIEEAVGKASFTVWIPARVRPGWVMNVMYFPANDAWEARESVLIDYRSQEDGGQLSLSERSASNDGEGGVRVSVDGASLHVERDGTAITLASEALDREELAKLADSLVPAPSGRSPFTE